MANVRNIIRGNWKWNYTGGQGPLMAGQTVPRRAGQEPTCRPSGADYDTIFMMVLPLRKMGMERLSNLIRASWSEAEPRFKSQSL